MDPDLLDLVRGSIRSVWTLELLLLLQRERGQEWSEASLVREMRASPAAVRESIGALAAAGLVASGGSGRVRYAPRTPELADLGARLAATYEQAPLSVIKAIASAPDERITTFADAFRFKQ